MLQQATTDDICAFQSSDLREVAGLVCFLVYNKNEHSSIVAHKRLLD